MDPDWHEGRSIRPSWEAGAYSRDGHTTARATRRRRYTCLITSNFLLVKSYSREMTVIFYSLLLTGIDASFVIPNLVVEVAAI